MPLMQNKKGELILRQLTFFIYIELVFAYSTIFALNFASTTIGSVFATMSMIF